MTEEQFTAATERLAKMQEQWIEGMRLNVETPKALSARIHSFQEYLDAHQAMIDKDYDYAKTVQETLQAVLTAFAETHATISENTLRLEKVITKMESYFGDGTGLEHEN
jgi:DNA repair exonuclease SbcCD ATPase subunit